MLTEIYRYDDMVYRKKRVLWNCLFILIIIVSQKSVISIVTKYKLQSVSIIDVNDGEANAIKENQREEFENVFVTEQEANVYYDGSESDPYTADTILSKRVIIPKLLWRLLTKRILRSNDNSHPRTITSRTTRSGLDIDLNVTENEFKDVKSRVHGIYPGTVWCGIGNLAENDFEVGFFQATDSCCREHDKCFDSIPGYSTGHGLTNSGHFTRSHCSCDKRFYYCLKRANSFVAHKIGVAYFNILRPQCFRKEHPVMACIEWSEGQCNRYVVDQTKKTVWQWFDNKLF